MRILEPISAGITLKADNKSDRTQLSDWNGKKRNDDGAKRCRCHFLTGPLMPVSPESVHGGCDNDRYELITQENYEFLRDSYLRYAELMGATPCHTRGISLGISINNVYNEMRSLIGDKPNLNIEEIDGRLYFNLWAYYEWGRFTVYYFPVKFIENLGLRMRRIAISFIHGLMTANGFSTISDDYDLEMVLEWMMDTANQTQEEIKKVKDLEHSYRNGKAHRLLDAVWRKSYYKNIETAVKRYVPCNNFECSLTDIMKEGMEFIHTDKGIMQYAYDPFLDEDRDYPPIPLERQIRVVYDIDDLVSDGIMDYFNCEQRDTYEITPVRCFPLSPQTDELFSMGDDYPVRFFKWADKFINIVS